MERPRRKIYTRENIYTGMPYNDLAFAIVSQAVEDYIRLELGAKIKDEEYGRYKLKKECETFLNSDWCYRLCGIESDAIWRRVNDLIGEANET